MKTFLSDKVYDILKWIAQFMLPASAMLYFGLSQFWALPMPEEVTGTIVAVNVFLGALLGLSTLQYNAEKKRLEEHEGDIPHIPAVLPSFPFAMSEKTYSIIKWAVLIALPATGTLYFALSALWGFPYGKEIVGSLATVTTFFGVFLGVSSAKFKELN